LNQTDGAKVFHPMDRDTDYLLPPSVQAWLQDVHLARYVGDVVEGLELSELEPPHADVESPPSERPRFPPQA
jgi:hypothetical protein